MTAAELAAEVGSRACPFFDAGPRRATGDGLPLGIIAGGLILDSGEAERTFLFRCQDRYFAYNTLQGLRTVLFVADDEHVRHYRAELADFDRKRCAIAAATGVLSADGSPEPLFVTCDIDRLKLGASWALRDQIRRGLIPHDAAIKLYLNQLSPTYAALVTQLDRLLRDHGLPGGFDGDGCGRIGALAARFHNKARYVELVTGHRGSGLPAHVPTAVIPAERFLAVRSFPELVELYCDLTGDAALGSLFVKSAQDSSGNVAARLARDTFDVRAGVLRREIEQQLLGRGVDLEQGIRDLRAEVNAAPTLYPLALSDDRLRRYKRLQAEQRTGIELLVQREVTPPDDASGRYVSVGLSYRIDGPDRIAPLAVAAQLYRDEDRRTYAGAYLAPEVTAGVLRAPLDAEIRRLCQLFAEQGYRGPISFDARLAADGRYQLIYDCNPRLTAIYPPLAVQGALRRAGLRADTVLSLGYRGEFVWDDLAGQLARIAERDLLYTAAHPRGALVLPNLSRRDGFDVVFLNVGPDAVRDALQSGAFGDTAARRFYV